MLYWTLELVWQVQINSTDHITNLNLEIALVVIPRQQRLQRRIKHRCIFPINCEQCKFAKGLNYFRLALSTFAAKIYTPH